MEAKEKAKELIDKFSDLEDGEMYIGKAKKCALIAVDEILDVDCYDMSEELFDNHIDYWEEVRHEINNL